MSDPRIATVTDVLREAGVQTNLDDTDTLATRIVNALDREHGTTAPDENTASTDETASTGGTVTHAGNPETPAGTGTDGGTGNTA